MIAKGSVVPDFQGKYTSPFVLEQAKTCQSVCCAQCLTYLDEISYLCHFGCGVAYCSVKCRSSHDRRCGHWFYCNGKINGKSLCLTNDFYHHSRLTEDKYRTSLLVIARIIANAVSVLSSSQNITLALAQSVSDFLMLFPDDDAATDEANEDTFESYSLLQALLKFEKTPSAGISADDWRDALSEISLSVYQHIVRVVENSMVPVKLMTPLPPLLEELKRIPLLSSFNERKAAVNKHLVLANASSAFLIPRSNQSVSIVGELTVDSSDLNDELQVERLAARLAQAADLACASDSSDNPLCGRVYTAMALIPAALYLSESLKSDVDRCRRLVHSCIPNVHLELVACSDDSESYKVQAVALRSIHPGEPLTYCYIDSSANVKTRQSSLADKALSTAARCPSVACCSCLKCKYELNSWDHLNAMLQPFLRSRGYATLKEGLERFEDTSDRLSVSPSRSSVVHICKTDLSQFLLLEVLRICKSDANSASCCQVVNESLKVLLNDAVTLADAYMQESKVENALVLYCSVLLSFYCCGCRGTESDPSSTLLNQVGEVVLSVGNALLDISIQPPETSKKGSSTDQTSIGTIRPEDADTDLTLLVEMVTAAPYELCHLVWKSGAKFVGTQHSAVNTHMNDRRSYEYDFGGSGAAEIKDFHQVLIADSVVGTLPLPSIFLSKSPILTSQDCEYVIGVAEKHATDHMNGSWTTSRHYAVPTTDIPIQEVPLLLQWFQGTMSRVLEPMLRAQFVPPAVSAAAGGCCVAVHDAFIVKYQSEPEGESSGSTSRQRYLPLHSDQSTHSLTIALNAADEYEGGGTYFVDLDAALRPDRGHVLSFRGELMHGGDPVTKGTRYILAIFLLLKTDCSSVSLRETGDGSSSGIKRKWFADGSAGENIAQVFKNRQTVSSSDDVTPDKGDSTNNNNSSSSSSGGVGDSGSFSFSFM